MTAFTHPDLPRGWSVHRFGETDDFGPDDVVAFWLAEDAIVEAEARRRVDEVFLVASDERGALVGVVTIYLAVEAQVRTPVWRLRGFVAAARRRSNVLRVMVTTTVELLEGAFVSGADTRGAGLTFTLQSHALADHFAEAVNPYIDAAYIGDSPRGAPRFLRWFAGASVLLPPVGGSHERFGYPRTRAPLGAPS